MSWGIHNAPSHKFLLLFRVSPRHPLSNHWNLIIPDNRFPKRSNHDRFGASSISLTRSWKYVGWLLGSSKRPLSLNCYTPQLVFPLSPRTSCYIPDHCTDPAAETATPSPSTSPQAPSTAYNSGIAPRRPCRGHPGAGDPVEGTALAIAQRLPCRFCAAVRQLESVLEGKKRGRGPLRGELTDNERDMVELGIRKVMGVGVGVSFRWRV